MPTGGNLLAIYVLLGWLDAGSNEFGEDVLVLQVFVEFFFTFEIFFMFFSAQDKVEGWNKLEKLSTKLRQT